jgi:hypothetical protein
VVRNSEKNEVIDADPFAPLNQAQNLTWGSMFRAQKHYKKSMIHNQKTTDEGGEVKILCAILWMDVELLQKLCGPEETIVLNRSTHTEYPNMSPLIHYPILQDTFMHLPVDDDHYLIYTNSDISVVKSFYTKIQETIIQQTNTASYDACTVNRRTITQSPRRKRGLSSHDLSFIERKILPEGRQHGGTHCFVIQKQTLRRLQFGKLFLGHASWARVLKISLENYIAKDFKILDSNRYGWTFHLGDKKQWSIPSIKLNLTTVERDYLDQCAFGSVIRHHTEHWLQNTWNCAEITRGLREFLLHEGSPPPAFLTPQGAEHILENREEMGKRLERQERHVTELREKFRQNVINKGLPNWDWKEGSPLRTNPF